MRAPKDSHANKSRQKDTSNPVAKFKQCTILADGFGGYAQ